MKRGGKKRKKLIALLSAAAAVLSLAGGGIGAAFAMAAVKKSSPSSAPSPSHLKVETQNQKKAQKEQEAKAESALLKKRQTSTLLSSPSSNSTLDSLSPLPTPASALGGDFWGGGILSSSPTPVSSPQAAFSSPAETKTLSLSSPLIWLPFDFYGNNASAESNAGWVDQEQIKSWVESGNYVSEDTIGFQNTGQGITSSEAAYKPPTESAATSLFGGVNPQTGEPVTVTSNGEYSQTFEQYVISLCMQNAPVSQGGQGVAAALGLSSSKPTSSQCLQAFQKNAEEKVTVGATSYDLLSYQGLSAFLKVLSNSVPCNGSAYNGYFGPGVPGPVTMKVSLSGTLLYLLSLDLAYPNSDPAYFFYDITAFVPPSYQEAQIKGPTSPWEFQQFPAHFKAYSESGQPLKQVKIALKVDSYPWPGKLMGEYIGQYIWPAYWDPSDPNNPAVDEVPESFPLASSSYKYFGWTNTGGQDPASGQFTLYSDPGSPGSFTIPNLVPGTYTVTVLGEGSEYSWPSFSFTLSSSGSETQIALSGSYNGIRGESGKGKRQKTLPAPSSSVTDSQDGIPTKESRGAGLNWICVWPSGAPAFGAAFSVQNSQGLYLYNTGSGWAFGKKQDAQQFSSVSSSTASPSGALFEILGLPFGTYTVSETSGASGADPTVLPSFNVTLNSNGTETISSTPASLGLVGNTPKGTPFNSNVFNTVESSIKSLSGVPLSQLASSSNSSSPSSSQTFASSNDPDGFVDASQETVITDSSNPSVGVLNSKGELEKDPNPSHEEGQGNTFSYQLSAFLPFSSPFSIEIDPGTGYGIELQEGKVSGIPISSLEEHGASLSGTKLTLNSSAIAYIEQNGFMPASATLPVGSEKLSTSSGSQRVFSVEFPAFLTSSFKAGDAVSYSLYYSNSAPGRQGQTITGSFEGMSAAEPWFRAISEDGKPLTTLSLQYMEVLATGADGATGTLTLSSPSSSPGLFTLPASLLAYMQNANSLYVSVQEGSYFLNYGSPDSGQSYQEVFYMTTSSAGGGIQFNSFSNGLYSFGRFSDPSTRTVLVGAANPSSQLLSPSGTVDSSSYPTFTVGKSNTFTYQLQSVLPLSGLLQDQQSPYYLPSSIPGITIRAASGEEILQNLSDVKIDGIPASTMQGHGMLISFEQEEGEPELLIAFASSSALSFIEQNGFMPATSSSPAASSPLDGNRVLSVTFKAYLSPTQGESKSPTWFLTAFLKGSGGEIFRSLPGTYLSLPQVYTNGPQDNSLPSSLAKAATVSSLPLSSPSSSTGLWFINGLEDACGADATQFTVQNSSGQYLSPVEDDGTFEGWQFSSSPYDFKGSDFNKFPYYYLFTFGGLANGTYTVKSVEHPDISFTSSLSYSSPQALSGSGSFSFVESNPGPDSLGPISWRMNYGVKDGVLEMTNSIGDPVSQLNPADAYALISSECTAGVPTPPSPTPAAPSHLPFTGGKGVLGLSLASSFLFLLGAGVWWGLKKKRGGHASSSNKHGF